MKTKKTLLMIKQEKASSQEFQMRFFQVKKLEITN